MNSAMRIVVVDDDKEMRKSLEHLLRSAGWEVDCLSRGEQLAARILSFDPDVVLSDVRMPGISGIDLLKAQDDPANPPMVLISAHGDIPLAVDAMQAGAYSFLEKPYDPRRLLTLLRNAGRQRRLRDGTERLRKRLADLSGLDRSLPGQSPALRALRHEITDLRNANAAVLITGEAGLGKAAVARAIHDLSDQTAGPFVLIECENAETLEQRLLDAGDSQPEALRAASGGTLFLSQIEACPPQMQPALLKTFDRAAEDMRKGLFRVVASAGADLEQAMTAGTFRRELFYWLSTIHLTIPPLRDRSGDIASIYAQVLVEQAQFYECGVPELTAEDDAMLLSHDWPGNLRELRHIAERHVLAARRGRGSVAEALRLGPDMGETPETLREAVAAFERRLIAKALKTHQGRMDDVAEALGIGRRTLNEKIVKLGLDKSALL